MATWGQRLAGRLQIQVPLVTILPLAKVIRSVFHQEGATTALTVDAPKNNGTIDVSLTFFNTGSPSITIGTGTSQINLTSSVISFITGSSGIAHDFPISVSVGSSVASGSYSFTAYANGTGVQSAGGWGFTVVVGSTAGSIGTVSIGSQSGTSTYGTASSPTYAVTSTRGSNGTVNGTYSVSGLPAGVTSGGFSPSATFNSTGGNVFPDATLTLNVAGSVSAGSYDFDIFLTDGAEQVSAVRTLVVDKAVLTATADNQTKVYGASNPTLTFQYSGWVNGVETIDTAPIASTIIDGTTSVGMYTDAITLTGGLDSNYTFNLVAGDFEVTKASIAVVNTDRSKVYGEVLTNADYSGSITGVVAGDNITVTRASTGDAATATVANSPYAIIGTLVDPDSRLANYDVSNPDGTLTVNQKAATVTANDQQKFCGQTITFTGTEFTADGLVSGDEVISATITSDGAGGDPGLSGSPYKIEIGEAVGNGLDNYNITYVEGDLTIKPVNINVTDAQSPRQVNSSFTIDIIVTDENDAPVSGVDLKLYGIDNTFVEESNGTYTFNIPGQSANLYEVYAEAGENCSESEHVFLPIYDPNGGFVTGGGWIESLVNMDYPYMQVGGKANFGFVAKYKNGKNNMNEVDGNTTFQFKAGDLNFKSTSLEDMSLIISGGYKATYKGSGTINGSGDYKFMVTVIDAEVAPSSYGESDLFRIKIWDGGNNVMYDNNDNSNNTENADPSTAISGGSIVIHKPKGGNSKAMEGTESFITDPIKNFLGFGSNHTYPS